MENKYFAELARRLRAAGITAGHPEKNRLTVLLNNQPVLSVSAGSDVFLLPAGSNNMEASELYHRVAQTADEVYAYGEEVSPTLKGTASGNCMPSILCLNDQGGSAIACSEDVAGTLRAQEHGHQPLVFENHGIDARYTGPHKVAPTMSARYGTGGNMEKLCQPVHMTRNTLLQTSKSTQAAPFTAGSSNLWAGFRS